MNNYTIVRMNAVRSRKGFCGDIFELVKSHNSHAKLMSCVLVDINPGDSTVPHRHIVGEELYFVIAGSGRMQLGEASLELAAGDVIHIPPGVIHQPFNNSDQPLQVLVVNAPPFDPTDVVFEEDNR